MLDNIQASEPYGGHGVGRYNRGDSVIYFFFDDMSWHMMLEGGGSRPIY